MKRLNRKLLIVVIAVVSLLLVIVALGSYAYAMSPAVIRNPQLEHYHFRMQVVVDGKAEDFGSQAYQTGYVKDQCNANLPEQPIHFHDNKDQFTHIHWEGMTGGMVMKYYGWNYIGGIDGALGYKLDDLSDIQKVTTHGDYLPTVDNSASFYIYTGEKDAYQKRSFEEWKNVDLEEFFGVTSNSPSHDINQQKTSMFDDLFPTVLAHGEVEDTHEGDSLETGQEKLTRINNLLGNVVIFVQNDEPTNQEIKNRFNLLEPLTDSSCGG